MLVLTFQAGGEPMALDLRHVREVVPRVPLGAVAGAAVWLGGVFVYRGQVVPVIDVHCLASGEPCPPALSSRVMLVAVPGPGGRDRLVGLLAAKVDDIGELSGESEALAVPVAGARADLGPLIARNGGAIRLFDVARLEALLPAEVSA